MSKDMYLDTTSANSRENAQMSCRMQVSPINQQNYILFHTKEIKEYCTSHHCFGKKNLKKNKIL